MTSEFPYPDHNLDVCARCNERREDHELSIPSGSSAVCRDGHGEFENYTEADARAARADRRYSEGKET